MNKYFLLVLVFLFAVFSASYSSANNKKDTSAHPPQSTSQVIKKHKVLTGITISAAIVLLYKLLRIKKERDDVGTLKGRLEQEKNQELQDKESILRWRREQENEARQEVEREQQARLIQLREEHRQRIEQRLQLQRQRLLHRETDMKQKNEVFTLFKKVNEKKLSFWSYLLANLYSKIDCINRYGQKQHPALTRNRLNSAYQQLKLAPFISPFKALNLPDDASPEEVKHAYEESAVNLTSSSTNSQTQREELSFLNNCYENCLRIATSGDLRNR